MKLGLLEREEGKRRLVVEVFKGEKIELNSLYSLSQLTADDDNNKRNAINKFNNSNKEKKSLVENEQVGPIFKKQ